MNMTLEQVRDKACSVRTNIESTRNAFPDNWQDLFNEVVEDLTEIIDDLARQSEGVSDEVRHVIESHVGKNTRAAKYLLEDLTAVWHNRPAQDVNADGWNCIRCGEFVDVCPKCTNEMAQEKAEPVGHARGQP